MIITLLPLHTLGSEALTDEPDPASYRYVSHYSAEIEAPADVVWMHMVDLGSWMSDFDLAHVEGPAGREGEVLRLYAGQDFLIQVVKRVPNRLLVISNLPSAFRGERSTGTGAFVIHESAGATAVDVILSRRYTWEGEGRNPVRQERQSPEFAEQTGATWTRFLRRLERLAEADDQHLESMEEHDRARSRH